MSVFPVGYVIMAMGLHSDLSYNRKLLQSNVISAEELCYED